MSGNLARACFDQGLLANHEGNANFTRRAQVQCLGEDVINLVLS